MTNIKVTISLNPNLLEALDAVAASELKNRSVKVAEVLRNDADIYEVLEGILEANKK
jgi:metal-responsive CopG/Arc/MetJ family transcriptional regulator